MQLAGLVASKAPSELDNTCTAAAPKDWKNDVSVTRQKGTQCCCRELFVAGRTVLSWSLPRSGAMRNWRRRTVFYIAVNLGSGLHLHRARAIHRCRSCSAVALVVTFIPSQQQCSCAVQALAGDARDVTRVASEIFGMSTCSQWSGTGTIALAKLWTT